ncbi:unnamed protein product [Lactuca saligna]|uniref:No apical meristem-associated C-terminal domain-containing protein n=1 Tax=Lactuca saligna TaxID=75948 RepID=A0AA35VWX0_LACSI|nr:unnamed protein product [Lactuca saligna]
MMNSVASKRYEADVLKSSLSENQSTINQKTFPHQKAWEWLKDHVKWALVTKAGEDSLPPSSKLTKTSSSNAHTTSCDTQYPPGFPQQQQPFNVEDSPPQRKKKEKKWHQYRQHKMKCLILSTILPTSTLQPIQRRNRDNCTGNKNYAFSKLMKH